MRYTVEFHIYFFTATAPLHPFAFTQATDLSHFLHALQSAHDVQLVQLVQLAHEEQSLHALQFAHDVQLLQLVQSAQAEVSLHPLQLTQAEQLVQLVQFLQSRQFLQPLQFSQLMLPSLSGLQLLADRQLVLHTIFLLAASAVAVGRLTRLMATNAIKIDRMNFFIVLLLFIFCCKYNNKISIQQISQEKAKPL